MKQRIVKDDFAGYEVQAKYWRWPWWVQYGGTNTFSSLEKARAYAKTKGVIEVLK